MKQLPKDQDQWLRGQKRSERMEEKKISSYGFNPQPQPEKSWTLGVVFLQPNQRVLWLPALTMDTYIFWVDSLIACAAY